MPMACQRAVKRFVFRSVIATRERSSPNGYFFSSEPARWHFNSHIVTAMSMTNYGLADVIIRSSSDMVALLTKAMSMILVVRRPI